MRLVDSSPTSNVARSDGVGRPSEATPDTPKGGLIRTIALINPSTGGTRPRGIARIDQDDGHARQFRLVGDKGVCVALEPKTGIRALDRKPSYEPSDFCL